MLAALLLPLSANVFLILLIQARKPVSSAGFSACSYHFRKSGGATLISHIGWHLWY